MGEITYGIGDRRRRGRSGRPAGLHTRLLRRSADLGRRLLAVPLFYKVLIANGLLVTFGAVLGTWFALEFVAEPGGRPHLDRAAAMAALATAVTLGINLLVLKAAFQPIEALGGVVSEVRKGNLRARAPKVLFTDPSIERMNETFNEMVATLQRHREQLQAMSYQVLHAQEDERKRIARELHDETAQVLTTLLIGLKMLERARDAEDLQQRTSELRSLTSRALEDVRDMALELRPPMLDDLGLVAALESYVESYAERVGLSVHFDAQVGDSRFSPQVELAVYRVVQEALTNVARHAGAEQAWVSLRRDGAALVAVVRDDGAGFDVETATQDRETGLGLFGMRERMALVGGRLRIESSPGAGTRISARVLLPPLRGQG